MCVVTPQLDPIPLSPKAQEQVYGPVPPENVGVNVTTCAASAGFGEDVKDAVIDEKMYVATVISSAVG